MSNSCKKLFTIPKNKNYYSILSVIYSEDKLKFYPTIKKNANDYTFCLGKKNGKPLCTFQNFICSVKFLMLLIKTKKEKVMHQA